MRRHGQSAQKRGFALAQGQGRGSAELVYLSQLLGEDNRSGAVGKKKENAARPDPNANLRNALTAKAELTEVKKGCEIAGHSSKRSIHLPAGLSFLGVPAVFVAEAAAQGNRE